MVAMNYCWKEEKKEARKQGSIMKDARKQGSKKV